MPSKTRGKYSKREWAARQADKGYNVSVSSSKPPAKADDMYSNLWSKAVKMEKEGKKLADFTADVAKLPYKLKDEFRKRRDPALDEAINKKEQEVLGGAIMGLEKYKGIEDPFARRALAEKYQEGLSIGLNNLRSEKERREGVMSDYIEKWAGLYGAEAAKQQAIFQQKQALWSNQLALADRAREEEHWQITQAQRRAGSGTARQSAYEADLLEMAGKVQSGELTREEAKEELQRRSARGLYEGAKFDINDIYAVSPDNSEYRPGGWKYKILNKEEKPATEWQTNRADELYAEQKIANYKVAGYEPEEILAEFQGTRWYKIAKEMLGL